MRINKKDIVNIFFLLLLNPVSLTFYFETASSLPDTFAYIYQAMSMQQNGTLNTGPWVHHDYAMILPPFYPLLIAMLSSFGIDELTAGLLISQVSAIFFSVVCYLYLSRKTNRILAFLTIITMQCSYIYFNTATLALTESTFMLLLIGTLFLMSRLFSDRDEIKLWTLFVLGIACSLVYLCREIGLTVLLCAILILILREYLQHGKSPIRVIKQTICLLTGFLFLIIPFYTVVFIQTGQEPLVRGYRLNEYVVEINEQELINRINDIKNIPVETYEDIYIKRRQLMTLLPDSTEMLAYVKYEEVDKYALLEKAVSTIMMPDHYVYKLSRNILNLSSNTGHIIFILFIFVCLGVIPSKSAGLPWTDKILIPLFIVIYLAVLSIFTDMIARYLSIVIPLIYLYFAFGAYYLVNILAGDNISFTSNTFHKSIYSICIPLVLILVLPAYFYEKRIFTPSSQMIRNNIEHMSSVVSGEQVFTLVPVLSYYINGKFRQLPNDRLDKVIRYGELTGVRWLLIVDMAETRELVNYWQNVATWMFDENIDKNYPGRIKFCCEWQNDDSVWKLYELNPITLKE